jgi:hypothetical protein
MNHQCGLYVLVLLSLDRMTDRLRSSAVRFNTRRQLLCNFQGLFCTHSYSGFWQTLAIISMFLADILSEFSWQLTNSNVAIYGAFVHRKNSYHLFHKKVRDALIAREKHTIISLIYLEGRYCQMHIGCGVSASQLRGDTS